MRQAHRLLNITSNARKADGTISVIISVNTTFMLCRHIHIKRIRFRLGTVLGIGVFCIPRGLTIKLTRQKWTMGLIKRPLYFMVNFRCTNKHLLYCTFFTFLNPLSRGGLVNKNNNNKIIFKCFVHCILFESFHSIGINLRISYYSKWRRRSI